MALNCVRVFLALCCILLSSAVKAQGLKPVWKQELSDQQYKQGDTVEIIFSAVIPMDLFVYGPGTECDIGPIKPSLTLNLQGATSIGPLYSGTEKKVQDEVFGCLTGKWEKKAELRQRVVITAATPLTYTGTLETQYCDDKKGMCFMQSYEF